MADATIVVGAITQAVVARSDITGASAGSTPVVPYFVPRKGLLTTAFSGATTPGTSAGIEMVAYSRALVSVVLTGTNPVATIQITSSPLLAGTYLPGVDSNSLRIVNASTEYLVENVNNYIQVGIVALAGTTPGVTIYVTPLV